MPVALRKPTLDELYRRFRDLDYTQVDERLAVMLNAILPLEAQDECRESATFCGGSDIDSYIGRWIVRLDGYNMIIEHGKRDKHQNADSLREMTEFLERQEQRERRTGQKSKMASLLWTRRRTTTFHSRCGLTSQTNQ